MKLLQIAALILCIQTPLIQSQSNDSIDTYLQGVVAGSLIASSVIYISMGIVSICNTRKANNIARLKTKKEMVTALHEQADDSLYKGINVIAFGAAIGIATGIGLYTNALSSTPHYSENP